MPKRVALPPELARRAFTVETARGAGIGEGRLRSRDLERPFHGVRRTRGDTEDFLERCRSYAPLLRPGQFFSHTTAARLWGCPLPDDAGSGEALHVSSFGRAPRGRGVVGHQLSDSRVGVVERHDLPTIDAVSMWHQLAPLVTLDDLVAVGDALILDPVVLDPLDIRPWVTVAELSDRASSFAGRGARAAASALRLMRQGAESRPETLLRLLIVRSGLPEPMVNIDVTDAAGRALGRGDLVYPLWRTVVEYDGDQHRTDTSQYDKDITRIEDFVQADWTVVRVRKRGLFVTPGATVDRIARALRARGWRA